MHFPTPHLYAYYRYQMNGTTPSSPLLPLSSSGETVLSSRILLCTRPKAPSHLCPQMSFNGDITLSSRRAGYVLLYYSVLCCLQCCWSSDIAVL